MAVDELTHAEAVFSRTLALYANASGTRVLKAWYRLNSSVPQGEDAERTRRLLPPPPSPYVIVNASGAARWATPLEARNIRRTVSCSHQQGRSRNSGRPRGVRRTTRRRARSPTRLSGDDSEPPPPLDPGAAT